MWMTIFMSQMKMVHSNAVLLSFCLHFMMHGVMEIACKTMSTLKINTQYTDGLKFGIYFIQYGGKPYQQKSEGKDSSKEK